MKQIKKLGFSSVISKLTRNEMRYVMAGSGGGPGSCSTGTDCAAGKVCCKRPAEKGWCYDDACPSGYTKV